ncbi:hypothetical protein F4777DRAFT_566472 [Nemania sp. FL0916]|nr:hypothetical protein F4777DRAFT_566472 [Nemania sp. FL0916]
MKFLRVFPRTTIATSQHIHQLRRTRRSITSATRSLSFTSISTLERLRLLPVSVSASVNPKPNTITSAARLSHSSANSPSHTPPSPLSNMAAPDTSASNNTNTNTDATAEAQSQSQSSSATAAPLPALPATGGEEGSPATLEVGGAALRLDHLGPLVVNVDGTLSRIANWEKMADVERENTLRILGKRNQMRLAKLRAAKDEAASSNNDSTINSDKQ